MNETIAHRGPNDRGTWADPQAGVALGHLRLSIIDLSPDGRQPMTNEDGSLQLVFNGEIYNYQSLRSGLQARGHQFASRTDTETIVHLYEEYGTDVVTKLNGIFAFAIWDSRRSELFLARDHLGVKPLYYATLPGGIAFSSELKSLLAFPEISNDVDLHAIHQHLSYIWCASPTTMFQSIRKLEPGHSITFRDGRIQEHRAFYDLPFHGETLPGTTDEHIAGVRERLQTAVTRQMVSDVPVGAFLSGGVDSSAIVSMMRSAGTQGVRCYTIGFDGQGGLDGHDEDLPYARLVAKHFGVELEEVEIQPDIVDLTERMVYLLDEPQADPACINVHLICEQAARDGYKVLLSGAGGDDIFSGYRRHAALQAERWWSWLPTSMRRMLASASNLAAPGSWWGRNLQKAFRSAPLPAEDRLLSYFLWAANNEIQSLYSPQVRDDLSGYDQLAPLQETIGRIPNESNRLNRMLYLETKHFLPDHNLNYVDKMSMAHGVEVRVPLLDLDLVNYVTSLPPHEKQRGTQGKWIFKKAVAPLLPNAVLRRSKTGFGAPLRRWIRTDLREMVRDVLSPTSIAQRGIFDARAVEQLILKNESGEIDAAYRIYGLMCIELWLRNFVDASKLPVATRVAA